MGQANFWGDLVRSLREEKGMSQRKLAILAKVNRSTLRNIEEGTAPASIDVLERCLNQLGHDIDVFEAGTPHPASALPPAPRPAPPPVTPVDRILALVFSR